MDLDFTNKVKSFWMHMTESTRRNSLSNGKHPKMTLLICPGTISFQHRVSFHWMDVLWSPLNLGTALPGLRALLQLKATAIWQGEVEIKFLMWSTVFNLRARGKYNVRGFIRYLKLSCFRALEGKYTNSTELFLTFSQFRLTGFTPFPVASLLITAWPCPP